MGKALSGELSCTGTGVVYDAAHILNRIIIISRSMKLFLSHTSHSLRYVVDFAALECQPVSKLLVRIGANNMISALCGY